MFATQTSRADLIFSVDLDPIRDGIQNSLTVDPGMDFQATIYMELTGSTTCLMYGVSLHIDADELVYRGGVEIMPDPLFTDILSPLKRIGRDIQGIGLATDITVDGPQAPLLAAIAKFEFTAPNAQFNDIHFNFYESPFDGSFTNDFLQIIPVYQGAILSVSSVPEPSLLHLLPIFGFCLTTSWRHRRISHIALAEFQA